MYYVSDTGPYVLCWDFFLRSSENPVRCCQLLWAHVQNKETKAERRESKVWGLRGGCAQGPPFLSSVVLRCSSPLQHSTAGACARQRSAEVRVWALGSDSGFTSPFHPWPCDLCKLSINYLSLFLLLPLFHPIAPGRKLFLPGSQVLHTEEISLLLPAAQRIWSGRFWGSRVTDASCRYHEPSLGIFILYFLNFFFSLL